MTALRHHGSPARRKSDDVASRETGPRAGAVSERTPSVTWPLLLSGGDFSPWIWDRWAEITLSNNRVQDPDRTNGDYLLTLQLLHLRRLVSADLSASAAQSSPQGDPRRDGHGIGRNGAREGALQGLDLEAKPWRAGPNPCGAEPN